MLPLWDSHKLKRPGTATQVLVTLNLLVFGMEMILNFGNPALFDRLMGRFSLEPNAWWTHRQVLSAWIPVLTSMFLHGGLAHAAGNVWFLWIFGRSLEDHMGTFRFVLIYFLSGLGAAAAQTFTDLSSTVPMIGASGAISGVMGAYLVLLSGRWIVALIPWVVPVVPIPAVVFLVLWFGIQLFNGVGELRHEPEGGVAWWAHVGGFAVGVAGAKLLGTASSPKRKSKR